ncbi:hypothetical protein [Halopiger xanaduensis]|uniref:Uncharacterized protein n=1 Tax=Halopiger xanaduensis (strain DSM 18323 / JCM 14033 / SH-6) TaxID=797210 RepID=F8D921_HALXS|nr:hypothetical protein [Halopiger xanaduensis]AEH37412.1 hypothetical protein Halxa_2796 [Halopiger xanaduensis SH-6]
MRIVLNESTKTAHKPARSARNQLADCGALRHVPTDRVRETSEEEIEPPIEVELERCGRCFEDSGGY